MSSHPLTTSCRRRCGSVGTVVGVHGPLQRRIHHQEKTYIRSYTDMRHPKISWTHRKKSTVLGLWKLRNMPTPTAPQTLEQLAEHHYQRRPSPAYELRDPRLLYGIQRLSGRQREVLECKIFGVLTFRQIADLLETDLDSVKHSYYRAIGRMRIVILTRDKLQRVLNLRSKGHTWQEIGDDIGVHKETARMMWYEARRAVVD